jgi:hypothetical protein
MGKFIPVKNLSQSVSSDRLFQVCCDPLCEPSAQEPALLALYKNTDGPNWINNAGWPGTAAPVPQGGCIGDFFAPLPDHCCWYGVSCCTCVIANASCACTYGTVIGLRLAANNVSVGYLCQHSMLKHPDCLLHSWLAKTSCLGPLLC